MAKWFHEDECRYGAQFYDVDEFAEGTHLATVNPLYGMTQRTDGARPPREWVVYVCGDRVGTVDTLRAAKQLAMTTLNAQLARRCVREPQA
jgi:hypothetical protein